MRVQSFNFSLPYVDSLTSEDTGLSFEFLQGFRLALYMFLNYKMTQQSVAIYQVRLFDCFVSVITLQVINSFTHR